MTTAVMFRPQVFSRPADIYTVRITEHEAQTSLALSLRQLVTAAGGTFMINLMEGPGFIFRMPTSAPSPFTTYTHGGLLEEGCMHVSKTRLDKEQATPVEDDSSDSALGEEDDADHPSLRMQWNWTELKRNKTG